MKKITLLIPEPYLEALKTLVDEGMYPNEAEAMRLFIRDGLKAELVGETERQLKVKIPAKLYTLI